MRTLDIYIVRNFLVTLGLFLVAMLLLRVVADLFVNIDEFLKDEYGAGERVRFVMEYYGYQLLGYFIELGGVVIVAAAVFALARMNHTNELTAMLASGVSLHRVVLPIVLCAMVMDALVVTDQELVIPRIADKLVRSRDEVSRAREFPVMLPSDGSGTIFYAPNFRSDDEVMIDPLIIPRDERHTALLRISGTRAQPHTFHHRPGWLVGEAVLAATSRLGTIWPNSPDYRRVYSTVQAMHILRDARAAHLQATGQDVPLRQISGAEDIRLTDETYGMTIRARRFEPAWDGDNAGGRLQRPVFGFHAPDGRLVGQMIAQSAEWTIDEPFGPRWELTGGAFFVPSDMTGEDLVLWESGRRLNYMSTTDLSRAIELGRVQDVRTAELAKHLRFTAPVNNLIMLLLGVPFILSRERNIKSSAAMCLLTVGVFFAFVHLCRQVDVSPMLAAWLPVLVFGPVSILMLDSVKT